MPRNRFALEVARAHTVSADQPIHAADSGEPDERDDAVVSKTKHETALLLRAAVHRLIRCEAGEHSAVDVFAAVRRAELRVAEVFAAINLGQPDDEYVALVIGLARREITGPPRHDT